MAKFEVSFVATVNAYKTLVVDASNEDEAYLTAFDMIEDPYYNDPTKWELEFESSIACDDVKEITNEEKNSSVASS